jgi:hypothetical protein
MALPFNPLDYPYHLKLPKWMSPINDWQGHIPFSFLFSEIVKPQKIVELGVYAGDSFFSFVQAKTDFNIPGQCIGIDHWRGDPDMGIEDRSTVYERVCDVRDKYFPQDKDNPTPILMRMSFDDALQHVPDGSVDLLHIDGWHAYEAVSKDFETWLPKLSSTGTVFFHDTEICYPYSKGAEALDHPIDGSHRFFKEMRLKYPGQWFQFRHFHGLGILSPGIGTHSFLSSLYENALTADGEKIRKYFDLLGSRLYALYLWRKNFLNDGEELDALQ